MGRPRRIAPVPETSGLRLSVPTENKKPRSESQLRGFLYSCLARLALETDLEAQDVPAPQRSA